MKRVYPILALVSALSGCAGFKSPYHEGLEQLQHFVKDDQDFDLGLASAEEADSAWIDEKQGADLYFIGEESLLQPPPDPLTVIMVTNRIRMPVFTFRGPRQHLCSTITFEFDYIHNRWKAVAFEDSNSIKPFIDRRKKGAIDDISYAIIFTPGLTYELLFKALPDGSKAIEIPEAFRRELYNSTGDSTIDPFDGIYSPERFFSRIRRYLNDTI